MGLTNQGPAERPGPMDLTSPNTIKELLARHGFRFSKSLGQNFLIARWVPERSAEAAVPDERTAVLEVGPGIGCLTAKLADRAGRVVSIELDRSLAPILNETVGGLGNVEILYGDALKLDLAEIVRERMAGLRPVVCANLPYNLTSPLIAAFISAGVFEDITIMIQREVARRLCSAAGSRDYGAFTLYVNWHCHTETLFDVPPDCFMPRPKVYSSLVKLTPREAPPAEVRDELFMFRIIRAAFNQRRKTLYNALSNGLPELGKEKIAAAIESCGLDAKIRGEALDIFSFAELANCLSGC